MSGLSKHIRIVHDNETIACPDCGKAMTKVNLNKHIKSVHNKLKKICYICNAEVPYSVISVHKRKVQNLGKPLSDITPRGPTLKLRKIYQVKDPNKLTEENSKQIQLGGKNFTFSIML